MGTPDYERYAAALDNSLDGGAGYHKETGRRIVPT
jgi:hypothetical protein